MANKLSKKDKIIVKHYLDQLSREIRLYKVLLFGSCAYGNPNKHSDIDLAIVSPDFDKMDFSRRLEWLQQMRDKKTFQVALDIIGYTPKEYSEIEKYSATMAYAKKHGQIIFKKLN
jgi:uncharacterized protein